jgi:hypothetical protein
MIVDNIFLGFQKSGTKSRGVLHFVPLRRFYDVLFVPLFCRPREKCGILWKTTWLHNVDNIRQKDIKFLRRVLEVWAQPTFCILFTLHCSRAGSGSGSEWLEKSEPKLILERVLLCHRARIRGSTKENWETCIDKILDKCISITGNTLALVCPQHSQVTLRVKDLTKKLAHLPALYSV